MAFVTYVLAGTCLARKTLKPKEAAFHAKPANEVEEAAVVVSVQGLSAADIEQIDNLLAECFHKYDLDGSRTCNSQEELQQMTINLIFTLHRKQLIPVGAQESRSVQDKATSQLLDC